MQMLCGIHQDMNFEKKKALGSLPQDAARLYSAYAPLLPPRFLTESLQIIDKLYLICVLYKYD